jgi:hypothetical protein
VGLTKYKIGDRVDFTFIGTPLTGVIIEVLDKTLLKVKTDDNGSVHRVGLTDKDHKYCFLNDRKPR